MVLERLPNAARYFVGGGAMTLVMFFALAIVAVFIEVSQAMLLAYIVLVLFTVNYYGRKLGVAS